MGKNKPRVLKSIPAMGHQVLHDHKEDDTEMDLLLKKDSEDIQKIQKDDALIQLSCPLQGKSLLNLHNENVFLCPLEFKDLEPLKENLVDEIEEVRNKTSSKNKDENGRLMTGIGTFEGRYYIQRTIWRSRRCFNMEE